MTETRNGSWKMKYIREFCSPLPCSVRLYWSQEVTALLIQPLPEPLALRFTLSLVLERDFSGASTPGHFPLWCHHRRNRIISYLMIQGFFAQQKDCTSARRWNKRQRRNKKVLSQKEQLSVSSFWRGESNMGEVSGKLQILSGTRSMEQEMNAVSRSASGQRWGHRAFSIRFCSSRTWCRGGQRTEKTRLLSLSTPLFFSIPLPWVPCSPTDRREQQWTSISKVHSGTRSLKKERRYE